MVFTTAKLYDHLAIFWEGVFKNAMINRSYCKATVSADNVNSIPQLPLKWQDLSQARTQGMLLMAHTPLWEAPYFWILKYPTSQGWGGLSWQSWTSILPDVIQYGFWRYEWEIHFVLNPWMIIDQVNILSGTGIFFIQIKKSVWFQTVKEQIMKINLPKNIK